MNIVDQLQRCQRNQHRYYPKYRIYGNKKISDIKGVSFSKQCKRPPIDKFLQCHQSKIIEDKLLVKQKSISVSIHNSHNKSKFFTVLASSTGAPQPKVKTEYIRLKTRQKGRNLSISCKHESKKQLDVFKKFLTVRTDFEANEFVEQIRGQYKFGLQLGRRTAQKIK